MRNLDTIISESLRRGLDEAVLRSRVRKLVKEAVQGYITETEDNHRRQTVVRLLNDKKYSNSDLAYQLYGAKTQSEKDTARSLFSKCVSGKKDADGNVHQFTDDQIRYLYSKLVVN